MGAGSVEWSRVVQTALNEIPFDRNILRCNLPLCLCWQSYICPARIGIRFKVAHMTNWLSRVDLAQATQCHHPPSPIAFFPVQMILPFLLLHCGPTLREPQHRVFIAPLFHERNEFAV